jgi:hypothetical protein
MMEYLLCLEEKMEWLDGEDGFMSYPLGSALLACVSGDDADTHPLLAMWKRDEESCRQLRAWTEEVLLPGETERPLERLERIYADNGNAALTSGVTLNRIFRREGEKTVSHLFFAAASPVPLLLLELEKMAEAGICIRKCDYCGKYFVPFSNRTLYCDRMVGETGKTCKELAAREKYENKIAADEGRALFNRRSKAYAMRVHRDPERFSEEEYRSWKDYAEVTLKAYAQGKVSLDVLQMVLELPEV